MARDLAIALLFVAALAAPGRAAERTVVAEFVGNVTSVEIPARETTGIPIGPDPRFAMKVEVASVRSGRLPAPYTNEIVFFIHSPSRILPSKAPSDPLLFTLVCTGRARGAPVYDLKVSALSPATEPSKGR